MRTIKKIWSYITWGKMALIMLLVFVGYLAYYLFFPFKVVDIKTQPFPVLTKQVKHGKSMIFHADYCKYMSVPTKTSTSFVDSIQFIEADRSSASPKGCHSKDIAVEIPETLPAGTYKYRITANHQVHPLLRIIKVVAETEEFEVID